MEPIPSVPLENLWLLCAIETAEFPCRHCKKKEKTLYTNFICFINLLTDRGTERALELLEMILLPLIRPTSGTHQTLSFEHDTKTA